MDILGVNSTGYGLLYEYDAGYVSPKDNENFITEIKNQIQKKSFNFERPTLIGVMQKYGVENKNGRIYPEEILRREVTEYMKLVKMGASAGETDHPECFCGESQILTSEGWKDFKDISDDEKVYTLNKAGDLEIQKISKKINEQYNGKAIKLKGLNIDCTVTPNHRFLVVTSDGEYDYITAQQILDGDYPSMSKCYIPKNINTEKTISNERIILAKNSNDVFKLNISNTKGIYLDKRHLNVNEMDYSGNVYCVNVENGNFYVKQNEKAHWSGNSAVISIKNTSMRITNLWWEGRTLMGEIYLPITKGYVESGVISHPADKIAHDIINGFKYGVSSRGVGSVEPMDGKNIVQDDFELICWDFVTTPSTYGSWTAFDAKDLQKYVEGKEPSEFEKGYSSNSYEQKEKEYFNRHSSQKKMSVEDALNTFMRGYK